MQSRLVAYAFSDGLPSITEQFYNLKILDNQFAVQFLHAINIH